MQQVTLFTLCKDLTMLLFKMILSLQETTIVINWHVTTEKEAPTDVSPLETIPINVSELWMQLAQKEVVKIHSAHLWDHGQMENQIPVVTQK